jgi:hypothetical protein
MAVNYTNGFVNSAATAILNALETDFGKYSPFGGVTFTAGGGQTWGYEKQYTTDLPTPQAYNASVTNNVFTIPNNSGEFQIDIGANQKVTITGVQFLNASNQVGFEVTNTTPADYNFNGVFTILAGSTLTLSGSGTFYDK